MIDLIRKIKFNSSKAKFFNKHLKYIRESSDYDQFLEEMDEKDEFEIGLWCVEIYDVIDNDCFSKVIKKLYSLKNMTEYYKVDVNYRKSFFSKLQYAKVEIDYTSIGTVGIITFKQDKYIKNITITKTQINSNEFVLCYSIHLKKLLLNYKDIHDCVQKNINVIKKSKNCTWYVSDNLNNDDFLKLESEWLRDWLQGTIEQLLFSDMGKRYKLPMLLNYNVGKKNDLIVSKLKEPFLAICFSDIEEEQFLHIQSFNQYEGCIISRYTFGKSLTESYFLNYFRDYGNEFYYYIFNIIENAEIERRLGRYFTSIKRKISIYDYKWLINKIRALKERKILPRTLEKKDIWINYVDGKKTGEKFLNYPNNINKYLEIYEQYFEYISALNSLSYDSIILWITSITLIVTIVGIVITN